METGNKRDLGLPIAVVIAGALIAASIYATGGIKIIGGGNGADVNNNQDQGQGAPKEIVIKPVSKSDHIIGKMDAPVTIVSYTDFECPFCKKFHDTMGEVMTEYRPTGKVSWVLRQFPLDSLHTKARNEAEATECAGSLGGNVKFWEFANKVFEYTKSNDGLDSSKLPQIANEIGLDVDAFNSCLKSGKMKSIVQAQQDDGVAAGARGTPYSVIITNTGKKIPIDGALPLEQIKSAIDFALKN
ncbi:MAG: thioredoxin domain-containing protein [bacterium]